MTVNSRVKFIRKMLKLNQTEFGKRLGVSRFVIVNIELERVEPKEIFLVHLAEVFGVEKKWLLSGEGDIKKQMDSSGDLSELVESYQELSPDYKKYLLHKVRDLLEIQKEII